MKLRVLKVMNFAREAVNSRELADIDRLRFLDDIDVVQSMFLERSDNSDYAKCTNEVYKYVVDSICDEGITKKEIKVILKKHFA